MSDQTTRDDAAAQPGEFFNRELSWLGFARRVLALVENDELPLFERVKFAGIMGMLHDEFFMKRVSGLKRQIAKGSRKLSIDGRTPQEEYAACRQELLQQCVLLGRLVGEELRPALERVGSPIFDFSSLSGAQRQWAREYFQSTVQPILTPLAVDAEHPFPFISNVGLNLAVLAPDGRAGRQRFVRIKVPANRPRWVALPDGAGFVPLEQIIAGSLDLMFAGRAPDAIYVFRVTRGASGEAETAAAEDVEDVEDIDPTPGSLVDQVSRELKARRFAGVVRLQVDPAMPDRLVHWLAEQLGVGAQDVYGGEPLLALSDLMQLQQTPRAELRYPRHAPRPHPRVQDLPPDDPAAIFAEIARGDVLLHHPYDCFDTSVLRFLESAAADPAVLAIKLTIYRTSRDSPIVRALTEASRRGKQVAVLVEITARFDEAPNIEWGKMLEREGAHVAYGVERLKTHVKLALVVREEEGRLRRYVHVGTGNYHTGTARIYEDLGLLTCDPDIAADASAVFDELTGGVAAGEFRRMIVAPEFMRRRFVELIQREAEHARAGRPAGVYGKMNQLQDPDVIRELYRASQAGVPIRLNIRGLCCLRPGVAGLSENIRVFSVVGRFLEHSRIYRFENGGEPEHFIGSADWMKRNLDNRVESIIPVLDKAVKEGLDRIIAVYEHDNASAWDCQSDGHYTLRRPSAGAAALAAQEVFIGLAASESAPPAPATARRGVRRGPAEAPPPSPAPPAARAPRRPPGGPGAPLH